MKRGQSAMEFLMTYGWAILIVIIVLSSLYFLGVFSPKTPNNCNIQAPFVCSDFKALDNGVVFVIGAGKISSGTVDSVTVNGQECDIIDNTLDANQKQEVKCSGVDMNGKVSANIEISYTLPNSNIEHVINGEGVSSVVETGLIGNLPQGGLVFGWHGDSVNDYVGGLNGNLVGGNLPVFQEGYLGDGVYFNGKVNTPLSYISYGNQQSLDIGTDDFSISYWFKSSSLNPNLQEAFISKKTGGFPFCTVGEGYLLYTQDGQYRVWIANGNGNCIVSFSPSAAPLYDGNWHFIVLTLDRDGNAVLYWDNVQKATQAVNNFNDISAGNFYIGYHETIGYGVGGNVNGTMDEVHMWNVALTPEEVNLLYNYYL